LQTGSKWNQAPVFFIGADQGIKTNSKGVTWHVH